MLQLLYTSTAADTVDAAALDAILAASRRNNGRDGVTGLLLYNGARFLQALEGEEAAVRATLARVSRDPRHRSVLVFAERSVATREFGEWAMAFERGRATGPGGALADDVARMVADLPVATRGLFTGFANPRAAA